MITFGRYFLMRMMVRVIFSDDANGDNGDGNNKDGDNNDSGGDDDDETAPRLICIPGEPFIQWESLHRSDWSSHPIILSSCHYVTMSQFADNIRRK